MDDSVQANLNTTGHVGPQQAVKPLGMTPTYYALGDVLLQPHGLVPTPRPRPNVRPTGPRSGISNNDPWEHLSLCFTLDNVHLQPQDPPTIIVYFDGPSNLNNVGSDIEAGQGGPQWYDTPP